jgi:oxepin-CoA hydrolase / 3-oxo-5,6-dehydrosuberyl-CoA semialdehyde dehydrogenase
MMQLHSYVGGEWLKGTEQGESVYNAINGEAICTVSSKGIDFAQALQYGRSKGGSALRKLTFHERALKLKALAAYLMERKENYYALSAATGATRADSWVDIEGGIGTVFTYASLARREFPNETYAVEGNVEPLSKNGTFIGRHILVPKEGVAIHINAFNFPCWGMLEKIAPSLIAGMPVIVKPASSSAYLTELMVRDMIASGLMPEGSIQLICGSAGDILDHVLEQDVVTLTGSAQTATKLRCHPAIVKHSVPFTAEADSLNCSILGPDAVPGTAEFDLYIKEVAKEMTTKAGQKCTAIRRAIVPADLAEAVGQALSKRLAGVKVGDPAVEGVRMGALINKAQVNDVWENVEKLSASSDIVFGGNKDFQIVGGNTDTGAFFPPTLLHCKNPMSSNEPHDIEAFGPVSTLLPYQDLEEAIELAKRGRGSLVGSLFTADNRIARDFILGTAAYHGRMLVINEQCAKESTGHGSPLATLVHGGPGRAGGGEELGGARAVKHYMQRTAIQGSPTTLTAITNEYHPGAETVSDDIHPFKKHFEDLQIGESLTTHRRTVTEADIVNFGCLSGDHFYAHFDELAAKDSLFGKRVAHGYFIISAAAGMFVEPSVGPVLANYGMDNLRFIEPVGIGDTIQVKITVKQKIRKEPRTADETPNGVVIWAVEVKNQSDELVAVYDILTLVVRRER